MKQILLLLTVTAFLFSCNKKFDDYYERSGTLADPTYQQLQAKGKFATFLKVIDKAGYKGTLSSAVRLNNVVVYGATGKTIPHVYVAYPAGRATDGALFADIRFQSLSKFFDVSRSGGFNDVRGLRVITLARSAETYLIAAEAKIRLANLAILLLITGCYALC